MLFYKERTGESIKVTFRKYESKDEKQLVACVTDFYGDGYPYKEFLEGEYLHKQSQAGNMLIICGEKDDGEIVSVSALNFDADFKKSGILMLRVVKKAFQNIGIGNKHQDFLFEQMNEIVGLSSLYADVMSHNTTSQNSLIREDFVYTGIRLMLYHNRIMIPEYEHTHDYKLSQVVMCKNISSTSLGEIYCPLIHRDFVEDIYKKLGVGCVIKTRYPNNIIKNSNISMKINDLHNHLQMIVLDVGRDFESIVKDQFLKFRDIEKQTYVCYLNMKVKGSISAYKILYEHGFFFTGLKPLNENGEFMILSKVVGKNLDINEIKIHKDGEYILDYILKHRHGGFINEEN